MKSVYLNFLTLGFQNQIVEVKNAFCSVTNSTAVTWERSIFRQ